MCVCVWECVYVCMNVYICGCVCECEYIRACVCIHGYTSYACLINIPRKHTSIVNDCQ